MNTWLAGWLLLVLVLVLLMLLMLLALATADCLLLVNKCPPKKKKKSWRPPPSEIFIHSPPPRRTNQRRPPWSPYRGGHGVRGHSCNTESRESSSSASPSVRSLATPPLTSNLLASPSVFHLHAYSPSIPAWISLPSSSRPRCDLHHLLFSLSLFFYRRRHSFRPSVHSFWAPPVPSLDPAAHRLRSSILFGFIAPL
ncbi:uncharacterized protein K452DRAFT_83385 [Aplosporella prunicola CBS 121167]|uniref:Uncharacterized protein n=1 Tax=Aplosporella prunicola CBS 121167 TaxID=1176127 RepID=A0A6A6B4E1_9PEZI|nr:uncharacterized protein K452DRAFT_83385 [Aplosporella prunicola CBS 121167]KAF2138706.1 hypothetical protein K452DRAFT_83385 [Aplosporella prunicola CBS 121167]